MSIQLLGYYYAKKQPSFAARYIDNNDELDSDDWA